jgi:hypothetical protein
MGKQGKLVMTKTDKEMNKIGLFVCKNLCFFNVYVEKMPNAFMRVSGVQKSMVSLCWTGLVVDGFALSILQSPAPTLQNPVLVL